jgi:hypothetical protein
LLIKRGRDRKWIETTNDRRKKIKEGSKEIETYDEKDLGRREARGKKGRK